MTSSSTWSAMGVGGAVSGTRLDSCTAGGWPHLEAPVGHWDLRGGPPGQGGKKYWPPLCLDYSADQFQRSFEFIILPQRRVRTVPNCAGDRAALTGAVLGRLLTRPSLCSDRCCGRGQSWKLWKCRSCGLWSWSSTPLWWRRGTNCGSSCTFHKRGFSIAELIVVCQCHRSCLDF